jgi:hypothetical protein
MESSL